MAKTATDRLLDITPLHLLALTHGLIITLKLSFTSKGKEIEIGSFLNEEDKKSLRNNISDIINTLNSN